MQKNVLKQVMQKSVIAMVCGVATLASVNALAAPSRDKVISKILAGNDGVALKSYLGDAAAKADVNQVIDGNLKPSWSSLKDDIAVESGSRFLSIENKNLESVKKQMETLLGQMESGTVKQAIDGHVMAPATYGAADSDSDVVKAAKWLNRASNSVQGSDEKARAKAIAETVSILEEAAKKTGVNSIAHITMLNKVLLDSKATPKVRGIVMGSPLPSSIAGARMLDLALVDLAKKPLGGPGRDWNDVAGYLFAAVIRCHGFADGNGRTARAAFALAMLKGKVPFRAIDTAGEKLLDGIDSAD